MRLADDVVLAELEVAFVFFPGGFVGDPGFGQPVSGADFLGRNRGDACAFPYGRALAEAVQADDSVAFRDHGHLISGGGDDLSARPDDLPEFPEGHGIGPDSQGGPALRTDVYASVVGVGFLAVFMFMVVFVVVVPASCENRAQGQGYQYCLFHAGSVVVRCQNMRGKPPAFLRAA